jgi:GT2 family glycosyltransferase
MSVYRSVELEHLRKALDSIYAQTYKGDLFVLIDGWIGQGIRDLLENDFRLGKITFLHDRDTNQGIAVSYNELFAEVLAQNYHYIARMDSDDIMMPERLALQYDYMEKNPMIDVVGGAIEEFGETINYHKIVQYPLTHDAMFDLFAKRVPVANVTTFFRQTFFEKAGLYPTQSPTNEDTLMWMQGFANGCRFANVPDVVVRVRVSSDFFGRRGGFSKAWSDFEDRLQVIRTLGYNITAYGYAVAVLGVNLAPPWLKKILYSRLR